MASELRTNPAVAFAPRLFALNALTRPMVPRINPKTKIPMSPRIHEVLASFVPGAAAGGYP